MSTDPPAPTGGAPESQRQPATAAYRSPVEVVTLVITEGKVNVSDSSERVPRCVVVGGGTNESGVITVEVFVCVSARADLHRFCRTVWNLIAASPVLTPVALGPAVFSGRPPRGGTECDYSTITVLTHERWTTRGAP